MPNKSYTSGITGGMHSLQADLAKKKISQDEFKFLVGFLLKNELNGFVHSQIDSLMPKEESAMQATYMKYQGNRKLNHAS